MNDLKKIDMFEFIYLNNNYFIFIFNNFNLIKYIFF